jgi:amino acid transporter
LLIKGPRIQRFSINNQKSTINNSSMTQPKSALQKAGLFYLVFVMFSYTTGGPFGLEDMVTTSGPGMTLIYLLVLPFFWCIPVSLVSAELTTAMPVEGGFYRWTRAAFGDFWGFLAGWWNWSASFLLGGAYAVLFTDYLVYYFPRITGWKHYLVSVTLIAVITWINVRGIQMVGKVATALEIFIFVPVITMVVIGFLHWHHNPFVPLIPPHQPTFKIFGVGLALGLAVFGIRTTFDCGGRSGEPATSLSAGASSRGAALDCGLLSADVGRAGFRRGVAELAYRIFF